MMQSRTSKVTLTIEGGIDIDYSKDIAEIEKDIICQISEIIKKRDVAVSLFKQERKPIKYGLSDKDFHCQQTIDIVV